MTEVQFRSIVSDAIGPMRCAMRERPGRVDIVVTDPQEARAVRECARRYLPVYTSCGVYAIDTLLHDLEQARADAARSGFLCRELRAHVALWRGLLLICGAACTIAAFARWRGWL